MPTHFEVKTRVPGVRARHRIVCKTRAGRACSCGTALRYVARSYEPELRGGQGGYISKQTAAIADAAAWKRQQDDRKQAMKGLRSVITLNAITDLWLADARAGKALTRHGRPYAPRSIRVLESAARNGFAPRLGTRQVVSITRVDVQYLVDDLTGRFAPNTVRSIIGQFAVVVGYAIDRGYRDDDLDLKRVRLPAKPATSRRAPSIAIAFRLIAALKTQDDRDLWTFFATTGARSSEAITLRWHDVDLLRGRVVLGAEVAKTPASRREVPIVQRARRMLDDRRAGGASPTGLVFPLSPGATHLNWSSIVTKARTRWDRSQLPTYTPHEFRHGFATWLAQAGVDLLVRRRLLGHAIEGLDAIYVHLTVDDLIEGVRALDHLIEQMIDLASQE